MPATDTPHPSARARLELRARRISTIRRRVAATSLATFALAFGVISQTGSMGAMTSSSGAATTPASTTTAVTQAPSTSHTTKTSSQATKVAAVTTAQS
jgi:anti-sigma factor RsiW